MYITDSCIISNQLVYKNEKLLFKSRDTAAAAFLVAAYRHFELQYPKFYKMDPLSQLGWLGAEILLKDQPRVREYEPGQVGIVLSNASSSLDTDIRYYETAKNIASPALFVYTLPSIVIGEIAIRHQFKGENAFFIFEEFDAGFIVQYVSNLVNNNILQACICGWVELLDEQYKTVLFLVERESPGPASLFTQENINKIYQSENG